MDGRTHFAFSHRTKDAECLSPALVPTLDILASGFDQEGAGGSSGRPEPCDPEGRRQVLAVVPTRRALSRPGIKLALRQHQGGSVAVPQGLAALDGRTQIVGQDL